MADRIHAFQVTIPPATAIATPQVTALSFPAGIVTDIHITVPPGPSGLVGFQISHSNEVVIPHRGTTFIIADDRPIDWPLRHFPIGNAWRIRAYNTDVYPHTLYLEFMVDETWRTVTSTVETLFVVPTLLQEVIE